MLEQVAQCRPVALDLAHCGRYLEREGGRQPIVEREPSKPDCLGGQRRGREYLGQRREVIASRERDRLELGARDAVPREPPVRTGVAQLAVAPHERHTAGCDLGRDRFAQQLVECVGAHAASLPKRAGAG